MKQKVIKYHGCTTINVRSKSISAFQQASEESNVLSLEKNTRLCTQEKAIKCFIVLSATRVYSSKVTKGHKKL